MPTRPPPYQDSSVVVLVLRRISQLYFFLVARGLIDKRVGYLGGMNLTRSALTNEEASVKIEGPVVHGLVETVVATRSRSESAPVLDVLQFLQQEHDGCEELDGVMFSCDEKRKACERRTSSPTVRLFLPKAATSMRE